MSAISTTFNLIDRMSAPMQNMIGTVNQICTVLERADSKVAGAFNPADLDGARRSLDMIDAQFKTIQADINRAKQNQDGFNQSIRDGQNSATGLAGKFKTMAGTFLGLQGARKIIGLSDEYSQVTSRINLMTQGAEDTNVVMNKIYASAQRARTGYLETADVVSKLGLRAKDAFSSTDETIQFAENLNKLFVISGASQAEIASASLQLTQALGSGVLRGEELNAVFESAPNVIQTIADYMSVPQGKIREMAAEGQITADIVKNALLGATEEINAQFEQTSMTWSQVWQMALNKVIHMSEPLLKLIGLIAQHWSALSPIIWGVVFALIAYNAQSGIAWATTMKNAAVTAWKTICDVAETAALIALTAVQDGLNAAMAACPLTWIIYLVIAFIAVLYMVMKAMGVVGEQSFSVIGAIAGAVAWLVAMVINLVVALVNAIIQFVWSQFVEPFIDIVEFILNACNGGFDSFGDGVKNLIGNIISWFLSLGKVVTTIIDAIFGTDWTSGLNSLQTSLKSWGKGENSITLNRPSAPLVERVSATDWYKGGYNWGSGISDKLFNTGSGLNDLQGLGAYDMADSLANQADSSAKTADNTSKIADNTAQSTNELKYLREIAERQAINRFTNTEVKVDMSGMQNTISSQMDIDGVINTLEVELNESLNRCAEGVS